MLETCKYINFIKHAELLQVQHLENNEIEKELKRAKGQCEQMCFHICYAMEDVWVCAVLLIGSLFHRCGDKTAKIQQNAVDLVTI